MEDDGLTAVDYRSQWLRAPLPAMDPKAATVTFQQVTVHRLTGSGSSSALSCRMLSFLFYLFVARTDPPRRWKGTFLWCSLRMQPRHPLSHKLVASPPPLPLPLFRWNLTTTWASQLQACLARRWGLYRSYRCLGSLSLGTLSCTCGAAHIFWLSFFPPAFFPNQFFRLSFLFKTTVAAPGWAPRRLKNCLRLHRVEEETEVAQHGLRLFPPIPPAFFFLYIVTIA